MEEVVGRHRTSPVGRAAQARSVKRPPASSTMTCTAETSQSDTPGSAATSTAPSKSTLDQKSPRPPVRQLRRARFRHCSPRPYTSTLIGLSVDASWPGRPTTAGRSANGNGPPRVSARHLVCLLVPPRPAVEDTRDGGGTRVNGTAAERSPNSVRTSCHGVCPVGRDSHRRALHRRRRATGLRPRCRRSDSGRWRARRPDRHRPGDLPLKSPGLASGRNALRHPRSSHRGRPS